MEQRQIPTSPSTIIDARKNNRAYRNHQRKKKRTTKRQQLPSPSFTSQDQQIPSPISNLPKTTIYAAFRPAEDLPMKKPFVWTKIWTKWFASCGHERDSRADTSISPAVSSSHLFGTKTWLIDRSERHAFLFKYINRLFLLLRRNRSNNNISKSSFTYVCKTIEQSLERRVRENEMI